RAHAPAAAKPHGGRFERAIVLGCVLALAAILAWREETSLDLGFHLATGRQMHTDRAWPRVDEFTYTGTGRPYLDMHGLLQLELPLAEPRRELAGTPRRRLHSGACRLGAPVLRAPGADDLSSARRRPLLLAPAH